MATIKRKQNGKIITNDGKVSCSCCIPNCTLPFCQRDDIDLNIFEITKNEYLKYYNGGTWTIDCIVNFDYYATSKNDPSIYYKITGYGSVTSKGKGYGCQHSPPTNTPIFPVTVEYSNPINEDIVIITGDDILFNAMYMNMNNIENKYFVQFDAFVYNTYSTNYGCNGPIPDPNDPFDPPDLGQYPKNRPVIIDGNNIATYGGFDGFLPSQGWNLIDNTITSLNATFVPDP